MESDACKIFADTVEQTNNERSGSYAVIASVLLKFNRKDVIIRGVILITAFSHTERK